MEDDELTKISKKSPEEYAPGTFPVPRKVRDDLGADLIKLAKYVLKIREEYKETKAKVESQEIKKIREILGVEIKDKKGSFSEFKRSLYTHLFTVYGITTLAILVSAAGMIFYFANKPTIRNITNIEKSIGTIKRDIAGIKEEQKKYSDRLGALEKSVGETSESKKNLEEQLKSYSNQITDLKTSYEKQNADLKERIDYNINRVTELEKKLNESEKKYEGRIKNLEKVK